MESVIFLMLILLTIFFIFILETVIILIDILNKKTRYSLEELQNSFSEIKINIKEKSVYIKQTKSNSNIENKIFSLEDYIYMISPNPDSKIFRELLKIINNGGTIKSIKDKVKELNFLSPFIINYPNDIKRISLAYLNLKEVNIGENIIFQSSETPVNEKWYGTDFINQKMSFLKDSNIFSNLNKDLKLIKTKGMSLVVLKIKKDSLPTNSDRFLNKIQLLKIKNILENKGLKPIISNEGKIYFLSNRTKINTTQKQWDNKIYNMIFPKSRYSYLDIDPFLIEVVVVHETSISSTNLNIAIIKSNLLFDEQEDNRLSLKVIEKINIKSKKIDTDSKFIINELKNNKNILKNSSFSFQEKRPKTIIEFYPDFPTGIYTESINKSFKYQEEIINLTLKIISLKGSKIRDSLFIMSFNINNINTISHEINKNNNNDNFLLNITNSDGIFKEYIWDNPILSIWDNPIQRIKDKNFNFILVMESMDKKDFDLMNMIKPNFIIIKKDYKEKNIIQPYKFIYPSKKNKIKILNLL